MPTGVRGKVHPHKTKNHITRRVEVARYLSEGNKKQNLIHISTPGASGPGKCHTASLHFPAAISIIITAISFGGFVQHNLHVGSYRPHEGLVVSQFFSYSCYSRIHSGLYGKADLCATIRNFPLSSLIYPKVYSTFISSPVVVVK